MCIKLLIYVLVRFVGIHISAVQIAAQRACHFDD